MDIAAWLRELGFERYAGAFQANDIDAAVLSTLNSDELKELGVASLGHRKKLLEAIAVLGGPPNRLQTVPEGTRVATRDAERRQLTVLFCDLVGSTELSGRLDPEDLRTVMRQYQDACAGVVTRFEGYVAKYMGDGVLAYFGYPKAHEDEAERAVRAALALANAVGRLAAPAGGPLAARIGIATGLVVVGELIGEGSSEEQAVVGETPNLAARLQALAAPGQVVIAASTRRLLGSLFDLADLGSHDLKGFSEPVAAWGVIGEGRAESRFEALRGVRITPLVGREHELGLLLDRWALAKEGEGQVVLLSGEPGIGKSRVTRAMLGRLGDEPYTRLRYYCSPYHTNSALYPVIDQLERAAGFAADDSAEVKLDKLEAVLGEASEGVSEVAPLLASLLSIPTGERYPDLNLTPQAQKAKTFGVLLSQLVGLVARQPVLMILEDAHWSDPTTGELFELVIDRLQALPILLLITFRPEFSPPWTGHAHVTSLTLNRLSRHQGKAMIERLAGGKDLPDEVVDQILRKTDGVPLFVEELTKTVIESGLLRQTADAFVLDGPLPPLAIPATLQDSLMARLDRMAPVKEVAQIGAVIGREFSFELLSVVSDASDHDLTAALDRLVASELIFRRGLPSAASYTFKHALIQDAAYQSLLKSKRQQLHARIARILEDRFPHVAGTDPELLAQHYTGAGLIEQAIAYWQKSGERAIKRSANAEAIRHLTRGLELVRGLPDGPERGQQELRLQITLGPALMALRGQSASEVGDVYRRALELGQQVGDSAQLFRVLWGSWRYRFIRAEHGQALELAKRCLDLANDEQDRALMLEACFALGGSSLWCGDYVSAESHLGRAIPLYNVSEHGSLAFQYGQDPGASNLAYYGLTQWFLGYPEQALESVQKAFALTEQLSHPATVAAVLTYFAITHALRGEWQAACERAAAAMALSNAQGFPQHLGLGMVVHGRAIADQGQPEQGAAQIEQGIAIRRSIGAEINRLFDVALLAESQGIAGSIDRGLESLERALELASGTGEGFYRPELRRLQGELLLKRDGLTAAPEAAAHYDRALGEARQQGSKSLELRITASLARLWADQGKRAEALELLAPTYAWFTEGFDTADLKNARAVLDELR